MFQNWKVLGTQFFKITADRVHIRCAKVSDEEISNAMIFIYSHVARYILKTCVAFTCASLLVESKKQGMHLYKTWWIFQPPWQHSYKSWRPYWYNIRQFSDSKIPLTCPTIRSDLTMALVQLFWFLFSLTQYVSFEKRHLPFCSSCFITFLISYLFSWFPTITVLLTREFRKL